MSPDILLIIGGTMFLMMAIAAFVLTQKNAWRAVLMLVFFFGGLNIGAFIWSEILTGWSARRLILFWLAAILPPLLGIAIGAFAGALLNWRISYVRPTYPGAKTSRGGKTNKSKSAKQRFKPSKPEPEQKEQTTRKKPHPTPRIID